MLPGRGGLRGCTVSGVMGSAVTAALGFIRLRLPRARTLGPVQSASLVSQDSKACCWQTRILAGKRMNAQVSSCVAITEGFEL